MNRADYTLLGIAVVASLLILVPIIASADAQLIINATIPITYTNGTTYNQPAFTNATGTFLASEYVQPYVYIPPVYNPPPSTSTSTSTYTPPTSSTSGFTTLTGTVVDNSILGQYIFPTYQDEYYLYDDVVQQLAKRTTIGNNYNLVENYITGEAEWTSTIDKIQNGFTTRQDGTGVPTWNNYVLTQIGDKITFNSNSIGGLVYDGPTCSYSIKENGYNGQTVIPSVSAVATGLVNGVWVNLPVNDSSCVVDVTSDAEGIVITSTKSITLNPITVTSNNGTSTLVPQSETFTQVLDVNVNSGIKETWKVWKTDDTQLGISQTVHTGASIEIAGQVIDIEAVNGQSFDRQFIVANEAEILKLTDSVNYDFDEGINSLTGVNIIYDTDYKVNLDYASGGFIGYLEIDPTFGYTAISNHFGWSTPTSSGGACITTSASQSPSTSYWIQRGSGQNCYGQTEQFDITNIPDTVVITNVNVRYDVSSVSSPPACNWYSVENKPSDGDATSRMQDAIDGTAFISNDANCQTATNDYVLDLGTSADTDLQNNLSSDWWGIGISPDPFTTDSVNRYLKLNGLELEVTYSLPLVKADPPTNVVATDGLPIGITWTAPSYFGLDGEGNALTSLDGYSVARTQSATSLIELPDNSGTNAGLDFSDNEFLLHGFDTVVGSTVTFSNDFSSSTGWTVGTGQNYDTSSGSLYSPKDSSNAHDVHSFKSYAIGEPDDMVLNWDWKYVGADFKLPFIILSSEASAGARSSSNSGGYGDSLEGQKKIVFINNNAQSQLKFMYWESGGSFGESDSVSDSATPVADTMYYYQFIKDGNDISVKRYGSIADRTAQTSEQQTITDTWTSAESTGYTGTADLAYIVIGSYGNYGGDAGANYMYDFELYSGVTSIVQGGDTLADKSTNSVPVTLPSASTSTSTTANAVWDSSTAHGMSISGNSVATTSSSWTGGVESTDTWTVGTDIEVTWTCNLAHMAFGFGTDPFVITSPNIYNFQEMEYRTYCGSSGSEIYIYDSVGNIGINYGPWTSSTPFKMTMDSTGAVAYYANGNLLITSTNLATVGDTYYLHAGGTSNSGEANNVQLTTVITTTSNDNTSTSGSIGTALQNPNLTFTDADLPDNTDTFSLGGFVKLDAGIPTTHTQSQVNDWGAGMGGNKGTTGQYIATTNSVLYNQPIYEVSLWCYATGSPTGDFRIGVWNDGGLSSGGTDVGTLIHTFGIIDASTVAGTSSTPVKLTATGSAYSPQVTDLIGYYQTSGFADASNTISCGQQNTQVFDGSDSHLTEGFNSNTVFQTRDHTIEFKIESPPANTKLLGFGTTTFDVGTTTASLSTVVTATNDYKVHTFTSTGTFQITAGSGNVDTLVIGGGGSGGTRQHSGGGGAGGFIETIGTATSSGSYTITVGAGGLGNTVNGNGVGTSGTYSAFDDGGSGEIKALGGGRGGAYLIAGANGGSGGGGGAPTSGSLSGGTGTSGQGNDGGTSTVVYGGSGSGGGGSGSVGIGTTGTLSTTGAGGDGTSSSISGSAICYAGGGAGSYLYVGGSGIVSCGANAGQNPANNADANTGAGGTGGGTDVATNYIGGNGGSGIIIVRYVDDGSITATGGTVTTITGITTTSHTTIISATGLPDTTTEPRHLAFTRGSSNDWTIYSQGSSVATATDSASLGANSVTTTVTQSLTDDNTNTAVGNCSGEVFTSGSALIGETMTSFTMDLKQLSSGTGTVQMGIFDESNCDVRTVFSNFDASTLTTSFVSTNSGTDSHVIADGDLMGLKFLSGGTGSEVKYATQTSEVYDGTNTFSQQNGYPEGSSDRDAKFIIYLSDNADYTTNLSGSLDEFFVNSDALTQTEITNIVSRVNDDWSILPNPDNYILLQTDLPNDSRDEAVASSTFDITTFTSDGSFVLTESASVDYLIVAGGGGGGREAGGGGGAGGMITGTVTLSAGTYPITIGDGGAGQTADYSTPGTNGDDSTFNGLTAIGGGGGATDGNPGIAGGSGGGSGRTTAAGGGAGGSGTVGQGNDGGGVNSDNVGRGGGGSGSVGGQGVNSLTGGNGGDGTTSNISGTNVIYAVGGGGGGSPVSGTTAGGTGSSNGDGKGAYYSGGVIQATAGTVNTGNGGGGGQWNGNSNQDGANGGSGIVIISVETIIPGGTTGEELDFTDNEFLLHGLVTTSTTGVPPANPDENFASGSGWTSSRTEAQITNNELQFNTKTDGVNTAISYDLGSSADDSWILRAKVYVPSQSHNGVGYGQGVNFGLSSVDSATGGTTAQDYIGVRYLHDNIDRPLGAVWSDDDDLEHSTSPSVGAYGIQFGGNIGASTTMYLEVIRIDATSFKTSHYSDSAYSSLVSSTTQTLPTAPTDLQYIKFNQFRYTTNQSGGEVLVIDDLIFKNGVTTMTATATWNVISLTDSSTNTIPITFSATSTTGTIGTAIQDPNLTFTDSNLPDNTDTLSVGGWVKLDPLLPTISDDMTDASLWTQVGTGVTITGGILDGNGFSSSVDNRVYQDVGVLDDKFIAQWDYKTVSATSGAYWTMFAFTDNTNAVRNSQDGVYALIDMGNWDVYLRNGDAGTETAGSGNIVLSANTQYYVTFIRDGSTTTLNIYTDSARTTLFGTLSTTIGGTVDGLQYFQSGATYNGNAGTVSVQLDNLDIWNSLTSVPSSEPTNTKLLGLNDVTFNVGTTTADVSELVASVDPTGLQLYYDFNDGSTITNKASSVFGSTDEASATDGNLNGGLTCGDTSKSGFGTMCDFDGSNDYIEVGADNADAFDSETGTLMWWHKYDTSQGNDKAMVTMTGSGGWGSGEHDFIINADGTGKVKSQVIVGTSGTEYLNSPTSAISVNGQWYHIAWTSDGSTTKLYVDGVPITLTATSGSNTGRWFGDMASTVDQLGIGGTIRSGFGNAISAGFDEMYIFNRALTETEIDDYIASSSPIVQSTIISATGLTDNTSTPQHYAVTRDSSNGWTIYQNGVSQSTATDSTSLGSISSFVVDSSRDGTNSGATSTTGKFSEALSFDGSNDSVSLGGTTSDYNFIHGDGHEFTMSFWLKNPSWDSLGMIFSSADELDSSRTGFGLRAQNSNGDIYYHFANGGNQNRFSGTVSGFSTDGNWHNIVVTGNHAGGTLKLWEDGTLIGTVSNSGKDFSTGDASDLSVLGKAGANGQWFSGQLDQFVIYDREITNSEISDIYNSGSGTTTLPSSPLVHYTMDLSGTLTNQGGVSTLNYHTTNLSGSLDEFFINSDTLTSTEISKIDRRGETEAVYTTSSTSFNDNTVIAGNEYFYKVYSLTGAGYSVASNSDSAQTVQLANAPAGVTATNGITQANVSWNASTDLGGGSTLAYKIYKNTNGGSYALLAQPAGTGTTYTDTAVTLGNTYGYKIVTVNEAGDSPQSNPATVIIGTVPDAPTLTLVTPIAGAQHTIDWTAPSNNGGFTVTGYEIERSTTSGSGFATIGQVGNVLTFTDPTTNLVLGDTYYYRILAINQQGTSAPSNQGSGLTGDKPSAVTNVTADALVNYEINLNWQPAVDNFYALTGYEIFASENGATAISVGTTPQAQTVFLHQGLNSGSTYTYAVHATNSLGTSTISNTPNTIAGDIPGIPQNLTVAVVVPSQLDVAWTASSANGYTPTYTVAISTDSGATWDETTHTGLTVLTLSQTSLVNGQTYQYKISATNTLGTSAYTAVVSGLAGDVPSTPVGLSVTPLSATELNFAWGIPNDNGYTITGYKVERSTDNFTTTTIIDANYQNNVYQDTGLTASTTYYYRVSAINALGTSTVSGISSGATYGVPDPVSTLVLTTISTSQIDLVWSQPSLNGYPFVDYSIERSFDGVIWNQHAITTNTTYQDTLNTNDNTEYHYRIITQNGYGLSVPGNAEMSFTTPTPPAAVSATVQSDVQIDLVWNNPTGTSHTGFLIEQSINSGTTWTTIITTTNQNLSYNAVGLTPLTDYQFRVSTVNQQLPQATGTSVPSPVVTATTFGHPEVPTSLTSTALPGSQIQLDWVAPTVVNGSPVTEYKIERSTDAGVTWGNLVTNTGNLLVTYTDTGLTTTQEYHYRISAYNIYGVGNPGNETSAIASDVPSQVTGLTATPTINYTIDLAWTTPNGNGYAVSGYMIERNIAGAGWLVLVADTASTTTTYADINLSSSTNYDYRVSAINVVGTGLVSATASSNAGDVPDAPVLTLTALPGSIIQLDWTIPTNNGFPITTYAVEKSTDGTTWSPLTSINANTFQDTGLTNTSTYYYKVTAVNQVGNSVFSSPVSIVAGDAPSQVTGLTATTTSNTSIDLAWTTPNANGYAVSGYMIERSDDMGATWSTLVANTQSLSVAYADTGLTTGTVYTYKVSGINALGTGPASATAATHAGGVPDAPVLTLTALASNIIQLDWTTPANNGFGITTYQVEKSSDGGITWIALTSINANTFQDTGLTTSTSYQYKVLATNPIGNSAFSGAVAMIAGDAPSQVTGLTATTVTNTSIDLAWTTPAANGYAVTGYFIESSIDYGANWTTVVTDTQSTSTVYAHTGLTTGQFYTYKISAINALGTGPASTTAVTHAGDVPGIPVLTLTALPNSIIQLDWTAPVDNGFVITTYQVEKSDDGGVTWNALTSLNSLTTQDTGLTNGDSYQYKVLATNTIGNSAFSGAVAMIAGDVPGALNILTATTQSDTSISLTWITPNANGYVITGYQIEQSPDGVAWTTIVTNTQSTAITHTVTGLTDSTDYYFKVSGINALGIGALGPVATAHTFGPPDPFIALTSSSTTTSATVNWTAPYDNGSPITSYRVEILNLINGQGNGQWLTLTTTTPTTLTNTHFSLQANTEYSYRIIAINPYGSVTSSIHPVTTFALPPTPTATATSGTTIDLSWTAVSGTTTYNVYSSTNNVSFVLEQSGITTTTYQDTGLSLGQTVYYKLSVTNPAGESTQSTSVTATTFTLAGSPTNLLITNPTPTTARLTWVAPSNNGGDPNVTYTLQKSTDNANWTSYISTTATSADDTNLVYTQQYYWRVNSVTSAGIGGNSNTVSYLTPDLPTAPGSLTAALTGTTNSASVLNWVAPSSTSGYYVIGYHIERNDNSSGWTTLVADTGNSGLVYTNTGLTAGTSYVYRISAITAVGEGPVSNTASVQPVLAVLTITGTPTGGNSVLVTPTISVTGSSTATIVQQALYVDNVRDVYKSVSVLLTNGATLQTMTSYPTQTSQFFATITLDTGYIIQSNTIPLTPAAPFVTGDISFSEDRIEYTSSATCLAAGGYWQAPSNPLSTTALVCTLSYTESVLDFTVQPVGAEVIISYQPQNLNEPAIVKAFTATSAQITESTAVDSETDYYGSIIVNPQFQYTVNADQTITIICDPNDIMCDDSDQDLSTPGIQSDVPLGVPAEKTFKSFKSPESTRQLGIEPMGNLFGVNMVFIFVIALAGIFTGRSAPMGVIFILVTLGIMAFLGYLDFGNDLMNAATWSLLIIAAILGIFLGKRWS